MTDQRSPSSGGQMSLMEHLTELRRRIVICVAAVGLGMALIGGPLYDPIKDILTDPYCEVAEDPDCGLLQTDPVEGLSVRLKVAGYGGIALAMPILLWQIWRFVSPGLYENEKRYAIPFIASALLLFFLGAALAYWTLPRALDFLANIGGDNLVQLYTPSRYFQMVTYTMLAFGVGFEFPILLIFLQLAGILDNTTLRKGRRYAIVLITILVAVVTPSGDPISMLGLSVPMVLFYELSIHLGRWLTRHRQLEPA
jgi:sec-independent protein translocase protein TatC